MGKLSDVCGTRVVLAGAGVAWLGLAVPAALLEVELLLLLLLLLGLLVGAGVAVGFSVGAGGAKNAIPLTGEAKEPAHSQGECPTGNTV